MAKNELSGLPFPPLVRVDTDEPLKAADVADLLSKRQDGVSICVRSAVGHADRGGYFFHIRPKSDKCEEYEILNFEKISATVLPLETTVNFINHCSGLEFNEEAFQLCQSVINFRLDPEPDVKKAEEAAVMDEDV